MNPPTQIKTFVNGFFQDISSIVYGVDIPMSLFESKQHFGIWHAWHLLN